MDSRATPIPILQVPSTAIKCIHAQVQVPIPIHESTPQYAIITCFLTKYGTDHSQRRKYKSQPTLDSCSTHMHLMKP